MATMYNISIDEIKGNNLKATIDFIHPDAGPKIESKDFALQIICYTFWKENDWRTLGGSKEDWLKSLEQHPKKEQINTWIKYLFGEDIPMPKEDYDKLSDDDGLKEIQKKYKKRFSSWGSSSGTYYATTKMNVADFTDDAEATILENPKKTKITKKSFLLEFSVNDPLLLSHIKANMSYETAAYSILDYWVP